MAGPQPAVSASDLSTRVIVPSRRAVAAAFAAVFLLLLLLLLLVERVVFLRLEDQAHDRVARAADVAHRIGVLDEQLTMAAHLVAQSNDEIWRRRHAEWLPQYIQAEAEANAMASPGLSAQLQNQTKQSCLVLEALEAQVLLLAEQGRLGQARGVLASAEYLHHKAVVLKGVSAFLEELHSEVRQSSELIARRAWAALALAFLAVFAALALLWRRLNRHLARAEAGFARQQEAQAALQAADRGKARILDGARAGTWEWSIQTGGLSFNAQAAAMLGARVNDPDLSTAMAWRKGLHPSDIERANSLLREHLKGRSPFFEDELRVRHRAGHWVWLQVRGQVAERAADGRAVHMAGSLTDMTARVQAEQLWQSRAELSSDWYWQTDTAHRMCQVHTGLDQQLAAIARDMLGKRRDEIALFDPPAGGWAALHACMDAHEPFTGVAYVSHAWGESLRWIEIDGRPRRDAEGHFLGYEGVGRDVTERRSVADELRASLALVDALFQAIPVPVVMKDMLGVTLRANRAYAEHYGLPPDKLLGRRSVDLLDPSAAAKADADRAEMAHTGQPLRVSSQARLHDGRMRDAVIHKAPLFDARGQMNGMVAVVFDVTDEKDAARALELARDAAEAANRAKGAFLATMSHEIRTPMNGVLGMSELLLHSTLDLQQTESVRTIMDSAGALLRIIDDILDFSKIEAGRLVLEQAALDPRALLQSVANALAPMAAQQGLELRLEMGAAVPARVWGDATRLRQVVTNLVGNALKFGLREAADGVAKPGPVVVSLQPQGAQLCLQVADSGIGMDSDMLERLFQPFIQAEPTTVRRYGGTGLGLAITRRLVSLMGGQIAVRSALGQGTTFTVVLDLPEVAAGPTPPPERAQAALFAGSGDAPLILVAEDDAVNRMVITGQLERLGYAAEVVEDGHAALALWRSGRFGLLLTDLHMPGMDGYELVRTIRQEELPGTARRPILALTANAMKGEERRALDAGMDAYLTKPIGMADLQIALQRSLSAGLAPAARIAAWAPPPTPGSAEPAAFEPQALRDLIGDDRVLLRRLLQEFSDSTPAYLAALVTALRQADWPAVHERAHSLKSAAQTVGALALARCCADAETAATGTGLRPDETTALAERITLAWPPLQQALRSEMGVHTAAAATADGL